MLSVFQAHEKYVSAVYIQYWWQILYVTVGLIKMIKTGIKNNPTAINLIKNTNFDSVRLKILI